MGREDSYQVVLDNLVSFQSALSGLRGSGIFSENRSYNQRKYDVAYQFSWIYRRVCNLVPSIATKEWGAVTSSSDKISADDTSAVDNELSILGASYKFKKAASLAIKYGGSALVMVLDDDREASEPIDPKRPGKITQLKIKSKYELQPAIGENPRDPETFMLYSNYGSADKEPELVPGSQIHKDRLLLFPRGDFGENLYGFDTHAWPSGDLVLIEESIQRYDEALCELISLLKKHSILIHAVSGLNDAQKAVSGGTSSDSFTKALQNLTSRLKANNDSANNSSILLHDKEYEDIKWVQRQLNGIVPIFNEVKNDVAAAANIPPALLFQQYGTGLGSAGQDQGQMDTKAALGEMLQHEMLQEPADKLVRHLAAYAGYEPGSFRFTFNPTQQPNPKTLADIGLTVAQTHAINIPLGVYSAEEARGCYGNGDTKVNIVLSDEDQKVMNPAAEAVEVKEPIPDEQA